MAGVASRALLPVFSRPIPGQHSLDKNWPAHFTAGAPVASVVSRSLYGDTATGDELRVLLGQMEDGAHFTAGAPATSVVSGWLYGDTATRGDSVRPWCVLRRSWCGRSQTGSSTNT